MPLGGRDVEIGAVRLGLGTCNSEAQSVPLRSNHWRGTELFLKARRLLQEAQRELPTPTTQKVLAG